jgi:hypothetical protein
MAEQQKGLGFDSIRQRNVYDVEYWSAHDLTLYWDMSSGATLKRLPSERTK